MNLQNVIITLALTLSPFLNAQTNYDRERQQILDIYAGEWLSQSLYAAAKLEIADQLDSGPATVQALSKETRTDPKSLYRLLRTLSSRGIFHESGDGSFSHTTTSLLLTKNHPESLRELVLFYGEMIRPSWSGLIETIKTGKPSFDAVFGRPIFDYFNKQPQQRELFHRAMAEKSKAVIKSSINAYDFSRFTTIYDIGGGNGHFLWAVMEAHPHIKGVLFDLPEVTNNTSVPSPVQSKNVEFVGGDFFKDIPSGGDIYILKSILHDWDDADAQKILRCCRNAMKPKSRLLIVEPVMLARNEKDYAKLMDVLMMNVTGGKERSLEDFRELLTLSGFQLKSVHPTSTEYRLLEARIMEPTQ